MRTVLHLIDVAELIRLSRASYWGRSMHILSSGPTRDPTDSHPPINHWSPPSGLRFLESPQRLLPVVCVVFFWVLHCYHRLWELRELRGRTRSSAYVVPVPESQLLLYDKIWTTPVAYFIDRGPPVRNTGPKVSDYLNGRAIAGKH